MSRVKFYPAPAERPSWLLSLGLVTDRTARGEYVVTAHVRDSPFTREYCGNLQIAISGDTRRVVRIARWHDGWARLVDPAKVPAALLFHAESLVLDCSAALTRG